METKVNNAGEQQPMTPDGKYSSFNKTNAKRMGKTFDTSDLAPKAKFTGSNSGYIGASISKRGKEAYESGEMPLSKWNKDNIIASYDEKYQEQLSKLPVKYLKDYMLDLKSWHHTGKFFNETNFYSVIDEDDTEKIETSIKLATEQYEKDKKLSTDVKAFKKLSPSEQQKVIDSVNEEMKQMGIEKAINSFKEDIERDKGYFPNAKEYHKWLEEQFDNFTNNIDQYVKKTGTSYGVPQEYAHLTKFGVSSYFAPYMEYSNTSQYAIGRKPNSEQYKNPESFFKKGEGRVTTKKNEWGISTGTFFQRWNGTEWEDIEELKTK